MSKGIDRFVSENRRATRRIDSTFVKVASQRRRQFDFGISQFQIPTNIEVYTRSLNDGLYSGHPEEKHGSGRGVAGDRRGDWELQTSVSLSQAFVRSGRNAIRDSLAGDNTGAVAQTVVGEGDSTATVTNTTLDAQTGGKFAWALEGSSPNETRSRSHFLFGEFGEEVTEFGVESGGGNLYNRITTSTVNPSRSEELRVDVIFEVDGFGHGNAEITDLGKEVVADTIRSRDAVIGINEFVFGSGDTPPTESDEQLDEEIFGKNIGREIEPEIITAQTAVFEPEPENQPVTIREMGVKDNLGRLIWRTTIDDYEKNDDMEFEVYAGFRAK